MAWSSGRGGRRSIVVRIFHNEGDFLEGLIAEAVAGKFAGQYLVVGGCPMDYGKLLELQSVAISKGALGVVAPFMEFVNPEAIPLGPLFLKHHPEFVLNLSPGDALRRGYDEAAQVLAACTEPDGQADEAIEARLRDAFGTPALALFRGDDAGNGPAPRIHRGKLRQLRRACSNQSRLLLDFADGSRSRMMGDPGAERASG
ncbi:MAG TPA: hypothetical protein VKG78_11535 [Opitutaceae bacterium]|nr:hypothetical protein [Opitutaceae bacterium]